MTLSKCLLCPSTFTPWGFSRHASAPFLWSSRSARDSQTSAHVGLGAGRGGQHKGCLPECLKGRKWAPSGSGEIKSCFLLVRASGISKRFLVFVSNPVPTRQLSRVLTKAPVQDVVLISSTRHKSTRPARRPDLQQPSVQSRPVANVATKSRPEMTRKKEQNIRHIR